MDWRWEVEGVGGGAVGGAVVGIVGPDWRPNMASMVGRSAAPRGVERKSAGRSDCVNVCLVKGTEKNGNTNAPLIHAGIDPPVKNPMQSFVKELQLKSTRGECRERAADTRLHADGHYPRYDTARVQGMRCRVSHG